MLKCYDQLPTKIGREYILVKIKEHKSELKIHLLNQASFFAEVIDIGKEPAYKININKGDLVLFHPPKTSPLFGKIANSTNFSYKNENYLIIHSTLIYAKVEPTDDELVFDYQLL